jgi:NAD(P)-dependent dehydrogenase (short-subunit alcohol dehydrogenase family)
VPETRSVVITGASRGLGFASAVRLYADGWCVVAAMRQPEAGLERLRAATGAAPGDPRLIGVRLDLADASSIAAAAKAIEAAVGAPDVLVHNAGVAAVGAVEELPDEALARIFATNVFGPVALTKALLPSMRSAGRGRLVVVSSQGGTRGMPTISAYSASKGALERWAESLAQEIAPFGLGVTILVTGTFRTEILTEEITPDYGNYEGPYARHYVAARSLEPFVLRIARPPERFAQTLARALDERAPFAKHAVGPDAVGLVLGNRVLSSRILHHLIRFAMGLPRHGALR